MDQNDFYSQERYAEQHSEYESVGSYTAKTFLWMFLGLLTTFGIAVVGYVTGAVNFVYASPMIQIGLLVAELAVVLFLTSLIHKLSVPAARALFFLYAAINGVVFSTYFWLYDLTSLVLVFAATALYFGILAAYGYLTHTDLSGLRTILMSGLIFLLVMAVLSLFLPMGAFDKAICLIGIAVFLGFTAYDTQKIRAYHAAYAHDPELAQKASIFASLQLYLDFINLFLYLLRFLGKRKN